MNEKKSFIPLCKCSVDDMSGKSLWVTFCDVNEMAFRPLIEPVGFSWTKYKTECTSDIQKTFILYAGTYVVCSYSSSHHPFKNTYMIQGRWNVWKSRERRAKNNVMGIICPPWWDRVIWYVKIWRGGLCSPPPTLAPGSDSPCRCTRKGEKYFAPWLELSK